MKILLPGGSGQVGTILARAFHAEVVVLSRSPQPLPWRVVEWDGGTMGAWARELDGADVVINLAGRSVNCRYTPVHRREILDSRVQSTRVLGQAVLAAARPPRVWLQASTATIYAHRYDAANDEVSGVIGGTETNAPDSWRFSIDVARAWESAFEDLELPATRKVTMRSAMTMSVDAGGVFDTLLTLLQRGLGGQHGNGRQFMSWVHGEDFIRVVRWLIERNDVQGVVNIASPAPIPNAQFMRELREAWGIRFGLPQMEWMLTCGAVLLGTETELILKSRRVVPRRLLEQGFVFAFPDWAEAARDLCRAWTIQRRGRARVDPRLAAASGS